MNNEEVKEQPQHETSAAKAWAVQINVLDMDEAVSFYTNTLGLSVLSKDYYPQVVSLKEKGGHTLLYRVEKEAGRKNREYRTIVNFRVSSLAEMTEKLTKGGYEIISESPEKNAIGRHLTVADPSGNVLHIMELDKQFGTVDRTTLFNVGIQITDLEKAIEFYESTLGMKVLTRNYWPPILPLVCGGIEIVLHQSDKVQPTAYPNSTGEYLILLSDDIDKSVALLQKEGLSFEYESIVEHAPVGRFTAVRDPFGSIIEILEPAENSKSIEESDIAQM